MIVDSEILSVKNKMSRFAPVSRFSSGYSTKSSLNVQLCYLI